MSIYNDAMYLEDVPEDQWTNYIGKGYRSVSYSVDTNRNGQIILLGFNTVGEPQTFICPHKSWIKYNVKYETDEKDMYGNNVETKYFRNSYERKKYVENAQMPIVECLKPEAEFLHKLFYKKILDDDFNKQKLRIQYIDIETEISDTFMKPSVAGNRINMITIYDDLTEKFYTWSLEHADIKFVEDPLKDYPTDKFVLFEFNNDEERMLEHFISWIEDNYPDVSFGWNTRAYDWPYIVRRIENVLGNNEAKRLSPVGKYFIKEVNHDNERADVAAEIEVNIDGLFIADGLVLYRDKFGITPALDGGYTLDNVGEHEECGHKIKYNGTLKDLYIKDWQKFYEYNVRDVDLAKRIEDKCKMIPLARQMTSFGLTGYGAIYSSISYLIGSVMAFARTEFGVIFNSYLAKKKEFDGFEGAFVFPIVPNRYDGGIACIDFASLYPSNMRSINYSPETYLGKVIVYRKNRFNGEMVCNKTNEARYNPFSNKDSVYGKNKAGEDAPVILNAGDPDIVKLQLVKANGKIMDLTNDQLKELIEKRYIWTTNNTLFLRHEVKQGIIAKWCEVFYGLRKSTQKKELECFHKLHNELDKFNKEEIATLETNEQNFHTKQIGIKSMINSIYGICGTKYSPIANPDMAQTVTRQGRFCNQTTAEFILKRFIEKYGADKDYMVAIGGDTDSQFINLKCVSQWIAKKNGYPTELLDWNNEQREVLWNEVYGFVENEINPFVRKLVRDYCHTSQSNVLTYELEYMSDVGIYEGKKHYATRKRFDEGDPVDKIKWSGIELKKTNVPKEMKLFLQDIYEGALLKKWNNTDYRNYICKLYDKFSKFTIDEISFWKGYITERQSTGFLQMEVGTTGIAKACTFYNQLLKKLNLGKKYDEIRVGDKVRFCYIEPSNDYGIEAISYKPGQWPAEFAKIFKPNYKKMFDKVILDPLKRFREACKFTNFDPSNQMLENIFDL